VINKINITRQEEYSIVSNHKLGTRDIHGREHKNYNYSSGKSPTCQTDAGNNVYSHDDCGEHPTQMLSYLTPERPKSSHTSSPDPSESILVPVKLPPSSPVLFQSSSLSDLSPASSELPDFDETSLRGGMTSDWDSDLESEERLGYPIEPRDTGDKGPFTHWVHVDYIGETGIK
jgi:hypothetical protein